MSRRWDRLAALAVIAVIGLRGSNLPGQELRFETAGRPSPFRLATGEIDQALEASGVAIIDDGTLALVAHDKTPELRVFNPRTGHPVGDPSTSPSLRRAVVKGNPKWEGMTRDSDGYFYLIGAHTLSKGKERGEQNVLIRFRLSGSSPLAIDDASLVRWNLSKSLDASLKIQNLADKSLPERKIEGVAIRERTVADGRRTRELMIGCRLPDDRVRVFSTDITRPPADQADLDLTSAFAFEPDKIDGVTSQLSSLEHVPAIGGFLVTTATEDKENGFHGNRLWFIADDTRLAEKVAEFEPKLKIEGLDVVGVETKDGRILVRLLLVYDNDPASGTKLPSVFQDATLIR